MIEIDLDKISKNELATILIDKDYEIERLNNIIVKLKKVLWQRCEEARKNEQYVRLNCYKDILNELVNTIYEVDGETNE